MESLHVSKGYGKVNPSEHHHPYSPPNHHHLRHRLIIIGTSIAVVVTLIAASLVAVLIHKSAKESAHSKPPELASNSSEALKTVCAVTRYPESCFSSISPLNSPPSNNPPLRFFNLSLHASAIEVESLRNLVSNPEADPAMKDCADLIDDAESQLGRSAEEIRVVHGEKVMTPMRISNLQTWISAAMTDEETCVEGLEEMGSTAVSEFKMRVQKSQEYLSNTLAILNSLQSLCEKFGVTMP